MQIPVHKIDESKLFIKWRDINVVPGSIEHAHRHNYFQFMFLEQVEGVHEIDFNDYGSENKSLHFVGKGRVHKVTFDEGVKGGVFVFPEELFGMSEPDMKLLHSLSFFKNGSHPILNLAKDEFLLIKSLIENLKQSLESSPLDISKYLLFALLAYVREIYNRELVTDDHGSATLSTDLLSFNQLLNAHAKEWNSIELFTNEIGVSSSRLNQLCKKEYGKTALQILHERKMLAAKRMLVYTDKQVKEIAYDCGFEDVAYFNRFFKKHAFCTPNTFRKNH